MPHFPTSPLIHFRNWRNVLPASLLALTSVALGQDEQPGNETVDEVEKPEIVQVSETGYQFGEIEFDSKTREIRFPAEIAQTSEIIEYVVVHELGKTHEAIFATPVSPLHLQMVLQLLNYESGRGPLFDHMYPDPSELPPAEETGDTIQIFAEWEGQEEIAVQELIHDLQADAPLQDKGWIYNGSRIREGKFEAEVDGSITAIYLDEAAMMNLVHLMADTDENWVPFEDKLPEWETPATVIFRPLPATDPSTQETP